MTGASIFDQLYCRVQFKQIRWEGEFTPLSDKQRTLIYPGYYDQLLGVQPWILVVLTVRNVLEVAILVWSVVVLVTRLPVLAPVCVARALSAGAGKFVAIARAAQA